MINYLMKMTCIYILVLYYVFDMLHFMCLFINVSISVGALSEICA